MLKTLLTTGLLLSAAAMHSLASENERYEQREGSQYETQERYENEGREYRESNKQYREDEKREYREQNGRYDERGEGSQHETQERYENKGSQYRENERRDYREQNERYNERGEAAQRERNTVYAQNTPPAIDTSAERALYMKECASCHFGYQPQLLPKRSWVKMMGELENHFGSDATLGEENRLNIEKYLVQNAGDSIRAYDKHARKLVNSIAADEAPQRISDTRYFVKEHRGIAPHLITQKEVKSISNCIACHTTAAQGSYGERGINIPNYGRWED